MWARLIVLGVIVFFIAAAANTASQLNQRLEERGVITRTPNPLQGLRQTVDSFVETVVFWGIIAVGAIVVIAIVVSTGEAMVASRRLLGVIPFKDLQRHLLILGPTGSGKTNVAKRAVYMAARKGVSITIIDWKGEYTSFIEGVSIVRKINVWDVSGRTQREKALLAVEILREVTRDIADVTSASSALLLRELVRLYEKGVPKTSDVMSCLETFYHTAMTEKRLAEANMAAALLRRLTWLQIDEERPAENIVRSDRVVIYDLSQTGSVYLKTIYSLSILSKTYYEALRAGASHGLRALLVAEECQNYIRGRRHDEPPSIGERIVNELRSFGVGVIMISPDPVQIPWHLARDVGAIIAIGPQAIPDILKDILRYDIRLERMLKGGKAYLFHRGKLHVARPPGRPPKPLRLEHVPPQLVGEEVVVKAEKPAVEEVVASAEPPSEAPKG
ncbi:MAG: DUF87 domain-containing protein [Nitrososphaerota archaeon]